MINLIHENKLNEVLNKVDLEEFINTGDSINSNLLKSLKYYLVLHYYQNEFSNFKPLDLFYNKYFWFLKYLKARKEIKGLDAGLEQQEFKLLEEEGSFEEIDWSIIESISKGNVS